MMPRSKSVDKDIKENLYYFVYEDEHLNGYTSINDIDKDVSNIINQYCEKYKAVVKNVTETLQLHESNLIDLLTKDVIFALYEHIRILYITYNSWDSDFLKENGLVRLNDYLKEKYPNDTNAQRRYKERFKRDRTNNDGFFSYEKNLLYMNIDYNLRKLCSIYSDLIFRNINEKLFIDKKYAGILDCFYVSNFNKAIKAYIIWDIDETWISEIKSIYNRCDGFQNHLIERLYHFITVSKIYKSKSREENRCFANTIQPLTMFGWGYSLEWLIGMYKTANNKDYRNATEFIFNAMSMAVKESLYGILNHLDRLRTNKDRQAYIDNLYLQYANEELSDIINTRCEKYKEPLPDNIDYESEGFLELCRCLLFNGKFKILVDNDIVDNLDYCLNKLDLSEDDLDDFDRDDKDDEDLNNKEFNLSFEFKDRCGKLEYFFESVYCSLGGEEETETIEYTISEDDKDEFEVDIKYKDEYIEFGLADYLYMITEVSYNEFFETE